MNKSRIIALMFIFLLFGCMVSMVPMIPQKEQISSFKPGDVQESLLGDPMLSKIDGTSAPGYIATSDFQPPSQNLGMLQFAPIVTGTVWAVIGKLQNGDSVCRSDSYQKPSVHGEPVLWDFCLIVNDVDEAYGYSGCSARSVYLQTWKPKPDRFLKKMDRVYLKGSFKQELIYNGKSLNTIKLSYHEFKDDFARPAFSKELTHDLSEGKILEFREMKTEVLDATNSVIKFIVRSPTN